MLNPLYVPLNKNLTKIVPLNEKMAIFRDKKRPDWALFP
jgi:hypothetical protein